MWFGILISAEFFFRPLMFSNEQEIKSFTKYLIKSLQAWATDSDIESSDRGSDTKNSPKNGLFFKLLYDKART